MDTDDYRALTPEGMMPVHMDDLSIAARVKGTLYYFPGNGYTRTLVDDSLHREVLRAMLQHAIDILDEPIESTMDGRPA